MHTQQPPRIIALITPHLGGVFNGTIIASAYRQARQHGARLIVLQELPEAVHRLRLAYDLVEGWLVLSKLNGVEQIAMTGVPVVTISGIAAGLPAVLPDNLSAAQESVEHLIGHGHRRIAFIGRMANLDMAQRFVGYKAALAAHNIPFDPRLVVDLEDANEASGAAAIEQLLAAGQPFSALVAGNDLNAIGAMASLRAAGRSVPEDVAVVGFDDIDLAQAATPPLTTVHQNYAALATLAVDRLFSQIADPARPPDVTYAPTALLLRRSCGCHRSRGVPLADAEAILADPNWTAALMRQLVRIICYPFAPDPGLTPARIWPGLTTLVTAIERAIAGQELPAEAAIDKAWSEAMAVTAKLDPLHAAVNLLEEVATARAWAASPGLNIGLNRALQLIRGELARTLMANQAEGARQLDAILYTNNEVSTTTLNDTSSGTPELTWLRHVGASWGTLGLWTDPAQPTELVLASQYVRGGNGGAALGQRIAPSWFPPFAQAALDPVGDAGPQIITLITLRSATHDWGILAIAGLVDTSVTWNNDPFAMWARMLSAALERAALFKDLAAQQQGLLQIFQRERILTATLRASEERYALAAAATNDGLWDWDLRTDKVYYSPRWTALLGYEEHEIGETTHGWFRLIHPDDLTALQSAIAHHHAGRSSHFEADQRMLHRDGEYRWMLCRGTTVYDERGAPQRIAGSISDVSQRKRFEEQLRHSALHDALTALPNRVLLLDRLAQVIQHSRRAPEHQFALLFLDLDRFKAINDSLGHLIGDLLLIGIAQRLRAIVRAGDTVARLGGDEFVILLDGIADSLNATTLAERIQEALRQPFELNGHKLIASSSIGILIGSSAYEQPEELLRDADAAMYRAKALGRGRNEIFASPLHQDAPQRPTT
jgi:diguanylate cyclase (GGDEF)-like protein/PAS domain S-box-containing protein